MRKKRKRKNKREEEPDHSPRERNGEDDPQEPSTQQGDDGSIMEEFVQTVDGGYTRKIVRHRDEWRRIITAITEDENDCSDPVGPCRSDFGHIGPDEEDRRYEYQYGEDGDKYGHTVTREEYRHYDRPPFWLPMTEQGTFYSTLLTELHAVQQQARIMWKNVRGLRFWDGGMPCPIQDSIRRLSVDIISVRDSVNDTLIMLEYDTQLLNIDDAPVKPDTVEQSVEHIWDTAGIKTRLMKQVLTTRNQVIKTEQYMTESKEWLTAPDWDRSQCILRNTSDSLLKVCHKLEQNDPEEDLIRGIQLFWFTNNYDVPFTNMDRRIDQMSERIIEKYIINGHLVNMDDEDRDHLKKYARQQQYFSREKGTVHCPACEDKQSYGFNWRKTSNICTVCISKRPGSISANNEEKCQDNYDGAAFKEHLKIKEECIYHGLSKGLEEMEQELENEYGTRVVLRFKNNNTTYQKMYNMICGQSYTKPLLLMVGDDPNWKYRKVASFYMKKAHAKRLEEVITEISRWGNMFGIKLTDRMGDKTVSKGRDWDPSMLDAEIKLTCDDELDLSFSISIRAMKGDSIATAINTNFFSIADSSNGAKRTRMDDSNEEPDWERLDDVKIHTNSYKTQEKTLRDVLPGVPTGRGHP